SVIGYNIAPAERVLQGEVPYRDFLFNYTPGILWVNALLMKAFGATLMATRIGLFGFKLITLLVLFHIGQRLTNRWAALVPVALSLAWIGHQQIFNVYPDQYLMLFALAALICMLNYNERSGARWLMLCGLATGAVFVLKYNVGVLLVAAVGLLIAARELMTTRQFGAAIKSIAIYLIGFGVIVGALVAYLVRVHALGAMVNHFLHHAAEYSETRSVTLPPASLVLPAVLALLGVVIVGTVVNRKASRFFGAFVATMIIVGSVVLLTPARATFLRDSAIASVAYFPPLVFTAALVLGLRRFKNERDIQRWWQDNGALTITGLFAIAVYLEVFPRADYYHLVRVLPPVFLFFCVFLAQCLPALKQYFKDQSSPCRVALLVASAPLVFLVLAGIRDTWVPQFDSSFHFKDNRELTIERGRGILVEEKQADLTEGLVRLIQDNSAPDDYIFSFAQRGSALYFLAARRNPTRFLWWRSVGISSEERDAVMKMIADRRAKLIIVQDVAANREIQDFIATGYDHIGTVSDIAVYGLRKPFSDAASDKLTFN
ncbi:MAG TPA: glycosyltransferase family 39 protein, partial [Blastocatellia bacterium]